MQRSALRRHAADGNLVSRLLDRRRLKDLSKLLFLFEPRFPTEQREYSEIIVAERDRDSPGVSVWSPVHTQVYPAIRTRSARLATATRANFDKVFAARASGIGKLFICEQLSDS